MPVLLVTYSDSLLPWYRPWARLPMNLVYLIIAAQRLTRERQQLAEMDAAQMMDVGLTEADCTAELRKPVWRRGGLLFRCGS